MNLDRGYDYMNNHSNLTYGTVLYIADDREKKSLGGYFKDRTKI
jgi:hypothetical protein